MTSIDPSPPRTEGADDETKRGEGHRLGRASSSLSARGATGTDHGTFQPTLSRVMLSAWRVRCRGGASFTAAGGAFA